MKREGTTVMLDELSAINSAWLAAWTNKDIPRLAEIYAEDCVYMDASTAGGLKGRAALVAYLEKLFPALPEWKYTADEIWPIPGGFCARWYCDMKGGARLRGFDFVQLRGREIVHNEVYTHAL